MALRRPSQGTIASQVGFVDRLGHTLARVGLARYDRNFFEPNPPSKRIFPR